MKSQPSIRAWFTLALIALVLLTVTVLSMRVFDRLDDLEKRVTTFETIRIEAVVPAKDSG